MECISMVSIVAFGPGDPGSNSSWFAVSNSIIKVSFKTWITQAYDRGTPIVIRGTASCLVGCDKNPLMV